MIEVKLIEEAPRWVDWIVSLGPFAVGIGSLAVAGAVAYIAHQQLETNKTAVKIAQDKRDDDLSERRVASLLAFEQLLAEVYVSKKLAPQSVNNFILNGGYGGQFVFDRDISNGIQEIFDHATTLMLRDQMSDDEPAKEALCILLEHCENKTLITKMKNAARVK